jgi:hypothetical protein
MSPARFRTVQLAFTAILLDTGRRLRVPKRRPLRRACKQKRRHPKSAVGRFLAPNSFSSRRQISWFVAIRARCRYLCQHGRLLEATLCPRQAHSQGPRHHLRRVSPGGAPARRRSRRRTSDGRLPARSRHSVASRCCRRRPNRHPRALRQPPAPTSRIRRRPHRRTPRRHGARLGPAGSSQTGPEAQKTSPPSKMTATYCSRPNVPFAQAAPIAARGEFSGFVVWFWSIRPISMRPLKIAPSSMLMRAV